LVVIVLLHFFSFPIEGPGTDYGWARMTGSFVTLQKRLTDNKGSRAFNLEIGPGRRRETDAKNQERKKKSRREERKRRGKKME